jgi:hypothetical protein
LLTGRSAAEAYQIISNGHAWTLQSA